MRPLRLLAALAVAAILAPVFGAAGSAPQPPAGLLLRGNVVTMDDARRVIADGSVLVREDRIAGVWEGEPPTGTDLDGVVTLALAQDEAVYPGLINLHAHPLYHALPVWAPPSSHAQPDDGRPTGLEPYSNRYQWNSAGMSLPEQRRLVAAPPNALATNLSLGPELLKWAEAMSALGGQTTYQGEVGRYNETDFTLVRNLDYGAFCRYGTPCPDPVASRVSNVQQIAPLSGDHAVWIDLATGANTSWFVHLAEGVRDADRPEGDENSSRAEFDHLLSLGLVAEETIVIHGTALEARDFAAMRAAPNLGIGGVPDSRGARLVWSPTSNLLLYGKTAHVYDAKRAGVLVTLGTDWSPSGTRNLLGEMKVADIALRDPRILGGERFLLPNPVPTPQQEIALDRWIVEMATRDPAIAIDEFARVGSVETGKLADLIVVKRPALSPTNGMPDSPYRRLIDATERDVRLVLIGGAAVAGDLDLMGALKPGDFETVTSPTGGYAKAVDITSPDVPGADQTLADVEASLAAALAALGGDAPAPGGGPAPAGNTWSWLKQRYDGGKHRNATDAFFEGVFAPRFGRLPDGRVNVEAIQLNPLLAEDDHWLFALLDARIDETPPYGAYAHNHNHVQDEGNPLAAVAYEERWYG